MNTVQPSHTQTLTEQPNQPELNISENQQGMSLPVSTHSYTIPHITHSRRTSTDMTSQQNCNRQSYRVPQYYTDSHSYSDRRRVRRQNTHNHHKERKHSKKDIENKEIDMDIYSLISLDYEYGFIHVKYKSLVVIEFYIINYYIM